MENKSAKAILNQYKTEAAAEMGVDLSSPELKARDAGRVGGQMVKTMISRVTGKKILK